MHSDNIPATARVDSGIANPLRISGRCLAAAVGIAISVAAALPAAAADPGFGAYWHDGQAELSGYRWSVTRYGRPRVGQAVTIYVTEPFSESKRVKLDNPSRNPADAFDAFKLNMVRDFQTGVYDYNTMVSVFTRSSDFSPAKLTFTSAEWCGHVYEELRFHPRRISQQVFSYFEGESSSKALDAKPGGVTEDGLFILLRGLRGAYLEPGRKKSVPFLSSVFYRRLVHQPIAWKRAEIHRLPEPQRIEVPAGEFSTAVYTVTIQGQRQGRFFIEEQYPHRVVQWSWQPVAGASAEAAESGRLTGTARLKYWQLHDNGHESYLNQLGLDTP